MSQKKQSLKDQYIEVQQRAFLREVNDEVKAERVSQIWHRYKYYIIGMIVISLSVVIINNIYISKKETINNNNALGFEKIMSNITITPEGKILELQNFATTAKYGYRDVAYFNIYSLQFENGQKDKAIATLKTLIDTTSDKELKNIAIVKFAHLATAIKNKDEVKVAMQMLSKISKNQPFYFIAQYTLGTIYIDTKNYSLAKPIFEKLESNEKTPISIKSQSLNLLNYLKSAK